MTKETFRAIRTRDAVALERDGQEIVATVRMNVDPRDGQLFEVKFTDGEWIIASEHDITEE